MSDLEPLVSAPQMVDPYVTRVLMRSLTPSADFRSFGATGTSCSIISIDDASDVIRQLETERHTFLESIRSEVILMTDAHGVEGRPTSTERRLRIRPRRFAKPGGGRAQILSEAVERASNEFVIVAGAGSRPLAGLSEVLGHMWVEGADIALLAEMRSSRENPFGAEKMFSDADAAAHVPRWLGLRSGSEFRDTLVMRRWLARWLFNEIDRAIDPVEEIADRVRLLGVTIVFSEARQPSEAPTEPQV